MYKKEVFLPLSLGGSKQKADVLATAMAYSVTEFLENGIVEFLLA